MKLLFALLFSGLVCGLGICAALAQAQTHNSSGHLPAPVVPGPFQALGNVIRNPDADPPRRRAAPVAQPSSTQPPPTIIPPGTLDNRALANPGSR